MTATAVPRIQALIAGGATLVVIALATPVLAQDKTASGQGLLAVDWADPEIAAFKRGGLGAGADAPNLKLVKLPVLAFKSIPQIVKNVAGPDAKPLKPRSVITDPKQPYWYQLVDTYEGITISVDADRRVNHEAKQGFQIGAANKGAEATLGSKAKPRISIVDNSSEEGMEGVILEYTVQKFPNIPYTVTIECSGKAKTQCKDLAVITKDEALLGLIAVNGG
jgi:hypothetical protein